VLDLIIDTDKMVAIMYFQCYRLRKNECNFVFLIENKSLFMWKYIFWSSSLFEKKMVELIGEEIQLLSTKKNDC
jgi:hypothetical protein